MMKRLYKWNPSDYAQYSSQQYHAAMRLIDRIRFQKNDAVLDIGCGDGKISAKIKSFLPKGKVIGIDSSKEMIDYARHTFPPQDYPGLEFKTMNATDLIFDEPFDIIFSNSALHWIKDQKAVLSGVKRHLKPAGRIFFQMRGKGNSDSLITAFLNLITRKKQWESYFKEIFFSGDFFDDSEYKKWICEAGLRPERVELVSSKSKHKGKRAMAGFIRTAVHPIVECIPEDLREEFILDLIDMYLEDHPMDEDGCIDMISMRLIVEASNTF